MRALILLAFWFATPAFALDYGVGLGLETRLVKDVNPGYTSTRSLAHVFQELRLERFVFTVEVGYDKSEGSAGGLSIRRATVTATTWARYAFLDFDRWSPYVTVGLGSHFDRVTSSFADESDTRRGTRLMTGLGGGIAKTLWDHLLLEGEVRGVFVREQKEPGLSLILRVGALF